MRKLLSVALCCILLCSCAAPAAETLLVSSEGVPDGVNAQLQALVEAEPLTYEADWEAEVVEREEELEGSPVAESSAESSAAPENPQTGQEPNVAQTAYARPANMTQKQVIEAYFDQLYKSYTGMKYVDISALMDMEQKNNRNCLIWSQMLAQRRRLIKENDFCYVETQQYPYSIQYIAESDLKDKRMDFWNNNGMSDAQTGEKSYHFVIKGQEGKAYPPILAVNTQHTIRMKKIGGQWKITFHYFPGSYRKFSNTTNMRVTSRDDMLAALKKEFSKSASPSAISVPGGAIAYDGANAARYGKTYTESRNPRFYDIGDWMGNCANFTSQCIWYGFTGDGQSIPSNAGLPNMTKTWYGGTGGGTSAWENVGAFWNYAESSSELKCQVLPGNSSLKPGDLIQTRSSSSSAYNHSLIVVDQDKLLLAQNSPGCFVYYSDLVDVQFRYMRPVYLAGAA